jgi:hypothetical protein
MGFNSGLKGLNQVVNSSRDPSNIIAGLHVLMGIFLFIDGFLLSFYAVWKIVLRRFR